MHRCRYCQHVSENPHRLAAHMRVCQAWKTWREMNLTREVLHRLYVVEERSMPEIVEMLNLPSVSVIYNDLKRFGFVVRSVKASVVTSRKQQRSISTCIERYGATNPLSNNTVPRKQMQEKLLKERGVTNVFQLPEVMLKIRDSLVSRPESITSRFSSQHREVIEFLRGCGFDPEIEFHISFPPRGYRSYDVKVGTKLIEVHGDYWHANPKKYMSDDIIEWSMGRMTAQQVWDRDEFKRKLALSSGYELFVVWENDWKMCRLDVERDMMSYVGLSDA
jgi:hypothetical protein